MMGDVTHSAYSSFPQLFVVSEILIIVLFFCFLSYGPSDILPKQVGFQFRPGILRHVFVFIHRRRLQAMQLPASFPRLRRFAVGFAIISAALVVMAPLAACSSSSSNTGSTASS